MPITHLSIQIVIHLWPRGHKSQFKIQLASQRRNGEILGLAPKKMSPEIYIGDDNTYEHSEEVTKYGTGIQ